MGRFQDADEGAYHEHVCSRAGIRVHYCGEQFENDGCIGSNLLTTVKRVMAGEYSRELSVKVFAEQARIVQLLVARITVSEAGLAIDLRHDGLGAVAADEGLSARYVSRLLRLAWLAPDVLERLVIHREPSTISIYDLCFVASLPWDEQSGRVFDCSTGG